MSRVIVQVVPEVPAVRLVSQPEDEREPSVSGGSDSDVDIYASVRPKGPPTIEHSEAGWVALLNLCHAARLGPGRRRGCPFAGMGCLGLRVACGAPWQDADAYCGESVRDDDSVEGEQQGEAVCMDEEVRAPLPPALACPLPPPAASAGGRGCHTRM